MSANTEVLILEHKEMFEVLEGSLDGPITIKLDSFESLYEALDFAQSRVDERGVEYGIRFIREL